MDDKRKIEDILGNLYKYNFDVSYKILEDFLIENSFVYYKDYSQIFNHCMFFPIKIDDKKFFSVFYQSSIGPIVIYHNCIRDNFNEIIDRNSVGKKIMIKQKGDILFEK